MIKTVSNIVEKMRLPILIINLAAIGAAFYKQGKLDAIAEINSESKN